MEGAGLRRGSSSLSGGPTSTWSAAGYASSGRGTLACCRSRPDVVDGAPRELPALQPELDDHVFTVEVEQWVSQFERERERKDPKVPASDQALWRMVRRVCRRAGVRELSPHQLRHGFANRFLRESGRDVAALGADGPLADRYDPALHR